MTERARLSAGVVALIAWFGLGLHFTVATIETMQRGGGAWDAVLSALTYYTILSNLLVALTMTGVAARCWPGGAQPDQSFLGAVTLSILITFVVFWTVLSEGWSPQGLRWTSDRIMHGLTPILMIAFWFVFTPKSELRWRDALVWPWIVAAYGVFALVFGGLTGQYRYFFLDAGTLGWAEVARNSLTLLAIFSAMGALMIAVGRLDKRRGG
jgi:hypothetical protein